MGPVGPYYFETLNRFKGYYDSLGENRTRAALLLRRFQTPKIQGKGMEILFIHLSLIAGHTRDPL